VLFFEHQTCVGEGGGGLKIGPPRVLIGHCDTFVGQPRQACGHLGLWPRAIACAPKRVVRGGGGGPDHRYDHTPRFEPWQLRPPPLLLDMDTDAQPPHPLLASRPRHADTSLLLMTSTTPWSPPLSSLSFKCVKKTP
jgi:hypothetical protein